MGGSESFYVGADYGLDPNYGIDFGPGEYLPFSGYQIKAGDLGYPSDPLGANQVDAVSRKLSTGAKTIEVSGIGLSGGGPMKHLDSIPKQQFEEIRRLKELTGVDLTFHGPLVEPTGISRQGWDDTQRQQAEKEIFSAVSRGHKLDPEGNIPIVFHSSAIGLDPETRLVDERTGKEVITQISVIDERTGQIQQGIGPPTKDYFKEDPDVEVKQELEKINETSWFRSLQSANFNANTGLEKAKVELSKERAGVSEESKEAYLDFYKKYVKEPIKAQEELDKMNPQQAAVVKDKMMELTNADIYLRDSYQGFKDLFNQAYGSAKRNAAQTGNANLQTSAKQDLQVLEQYREKIIPKIRAVEKDPSKIIEFGQEINEGVNVLRQVKAPQHLRPMKDFMIDKASDTFANAAFKAYKEFEDTAPVIAIENPPAGESPLSRADEMKDLVVSARDKFAKRAQKELGISEAKAKKQAEKLIGATWDLGHINMIRKFGYDEKKILEETETIGPYVKHVHLSDNFGLAHTELPMGMGNVPTKKHLEIIDKYNKQVKKIVETGDWYSRQGGLGQPQTPVIQSAAAFGSPVYSMKMSPYWNQAAGTMAGYYAGLGPTNPQHHHALYGAGYSNLPVMLGGQMAGRSRVGGSPME